jgi:hypothetical protein
MRAPEVRQRAASACGSPVVAPGPCPVATTANIWISLLSAQVAATAASSSSHRRRSARAPGPAPRSMAWVLRPPSRVFAPPSWS